MRSKFQEKGQAGIELVFLISLIAIMTISSMLLLRDTINAKYVDVNDKLLYNGDFGILGELVSMVEPDPESKNSFVSVANLAALDELITDSESMNNYEFRLNNEPVCVLYEENKNKNIPSTPACSDIDKAKDTIYVLRDNEGSWEFTYDFKNPEDVVVEGCETPNTCFDPSWNLSVHELEGTE